MKITYTDTRLIVNEEVHQKFMTGNFIINNDSSDKFLFYVEVKFGVIKPSEDLDGDWMAIDLVWEDYFVFTSGWYHKKTILDIDDMVSTFECEVTEDVNLWNWIKITFRQLRKRF